MKCVETIFFDIFGYFEIPVFEITKVNSISFYIFRWLPLKGPMFTNLRSGKRKEIHRFVRNTSFIFTGNDENKIRIKH